MYIILRGPVLQGIGPGLYPEDAFPYFYTIPNFLIIPGINYIVVSIIKVFLQARYLLPS